MTEDKNQPLRSIEELGEFALIDHLTAHFETRRSETLKSIGDDAALLDMGGQKTVLSTDMLVEGIHFNLSYMPMRHLGYKSVVVNVSDICAMNARPTHITVSISVSNRFSVEALEEFYQGVNDACAHYKVDLVGGDTTASLKGMTISVTALGSVSEDRVAFRSGAQENDLVVVSGDLGGAYLGFQVLERERQVFEVNPQHEPDLDPYHYVVQRQLKPEARLDMVELLEALEVRPSAMIDISDGLSSEALHLCKQSNLGIALYEEKLPIDPTVISACDEFNLNPTVAVLSGGEDYELLFTIRQDDFLKIKGNPNLTVIGHMTEKTSGAQLVLRSGELAELKAQGWTSF
ncbi:MAG: thiamine-phosphate kinase [Flavobacteriaceae bacterium]